MYSFLFAAYCECCIHVRVKNLYFFKQTENEVSQVCSLRSNSQGTNLRSDLSGVELR